MNKNVLIICESMYHGNTQKLAVAMAQKLNCQVVSGDEALALDVSQYEIIGLGSGIYFTSHHPKLFKIVKKLDVGQKTFLFSTHGAPFCGKYHSPLKEALEKKGISVIGEFSCRGYDCTGPYIIVGGGNKGKPNEKDQRKAQKFISGLLPQFCKDTDKVDNGKTIQIRFDECISCGKCEKICPMNVFEMNDQTPVIKSESDCIHCSLCKEQCPVQAISVQHSWKEAIAIAKRHSKKTSL